MAPRAVSESLQKAIDQAIASTPSNKRGVFKAALTLDGAQVEVAHRINPNWSVGAFGAFDWRTREKEVGAQLQGSW